MENHRTALSAGLVAAGPQTAGPGLADEIHGAQAEVDGLHTLLDGLEIHLFGPTPKDDLVADCDGRPPILMAARSTHRGLMSANERLRSILNRL